MNIDSIKLAAVADELEKMARSSDSNKSRSSRYLIPASIAGGALAIGGGAAALAMMKRRRMPKPGIPKFMSEGKFHEMARDVMESKPSMIVGMPKDQVSEITGLQKQIESIESAISSLKRMGL